MKFALIHFRVGELDGVSLEMDKWIKVLGENLGHESTYLAGSIGTSSGFVIPELAIDYPPSLNIRKRSFQTKLSPEEEKKLEQQINELVAQIKPQLLEFIKNEKIDCLVINNMFCYPLNFPASIALAEVSNDLNIAVISHNHDFFWERDVFNPSCSYVENLLKKYFPPSFPNYQQVVINNNARLGLKERNGLDSTYVPNVFYFEEPDWIVDSYNSDLRKSLDIQENDIVFLQGTRIVDRKGIELVIDLINELKSSQNIKKLTSKSLFDGRSFNSENKLILVMPNLVEDEKYRKKLENKCKELNVEYRFCNNDFAHQRGKKQDNSKIYSLWDSYTIADIITYPSLLEGWGNQFLEAVKAKVPIILFEYEVYKKDIGPMGFETISLGSTYVKNENGLASVPNSILKEAANQTIYLLQNKEMRENMVEKNYIVGKDKFSLTALGKYLKPLIDNV